jgi:predicted nucleotide-binding protein
MADVIAEGRARLDEIIDHGAALLRTKRSGEWGMDYLSDQAAYEKWRLTAKTALRMLDPTGDHREEFEVVGNKPVTWGDDYPRRLERLLAILEAFREDFDRIGAMARRPPEPPPIQIRKLTAQEVDIGIAKLRRRIEEIQRFGTDQVPHDDGQKESAEARVRNMICEIFGENSPQFRDNQHFEIHKGLLFAGASSTEHQKWFMDGIPPAVALLKGLISELEEQREFAAPVATIPAAKPKVPSRRVFVVHGHDDAAKEAVARFLTALDFKPIILHERPNAGRTVIEKFEEYSDVEFAVVLLTPDDLASSKATPGETHERARQNVIFELGFFIGRLGRPKVCALVKGAVERPSDYDGVVYVKMDSGNGWKMALAREMREAGLPVDAEKVMAA